jgi:hypothetical protein
MINRLNILRKPLLDVNYIDDDIKDYIDDIMKIYLTNHGNLVNSGDKGYIDIDLFTPIYRPE